MLKKLLANKKLLAVIVALIVIIVGIVIAVVKNQDSRETGKSGVSIENEKDDEQDEPYNGTGLEIMDEVDGTVDSVDGSGDWDGTSNGNSKKEQDNKADDAQSDDTQTDNTQSDDTEKEEPNDKGDNADGELEGDILVDDKVWGEIS